MALRTPDKEDERNPAKNVGDEHYKKQTKRYDQRQRQPSNDSSDPRGDGSDEVASEDASDPRSEDLGNQETQAATDSSQRQSQLGDDIGTQESRGSTFRNRVTEKSPSSGGGGLKGKLSKPRNMILLVGAVLSAVGLFFAVLLTPAFALVALKETLLNKFDDRTQTSQHKRNLRLLNKKLTGDPLTAGCGTVKIKCRFKGMSKREAAKFEKRNPGSKVNTGRCLLGRCKVESIEFDDSDGKRKTVTPGEFKNTLKTNREFRAHIYRYNKSVVAHFRDKTFGKVAKKLNLFFGKHTSDKPPPGEGTDAERAKAAAEEKAAADKAAAEKQAQRDKIKSRLGKAVGAIGIICVARSLIKASGNLAKLELTAKLIPLAVNFINAADDIKNGTATGDKGTQNNISALGEQLVQKDKNGQTAFDSFGWQYAANGIIDNKTEKNAQQFQLGAGADTGAIGQLANKGKPKQVLDSLDKIGLNKVCPIFENLIIGSLACIAAAPTLVGLGLCGLSTAAGVTLLPIATKYLLENLVKTTSTVGLVGGDAANAATGGFSALESTNNRSRGAYPLKKDQAIKFDKFSDNAQAGGAWVGKDPKTGFLDNNPFSRFSHNLAIAALPSLSNLSNLSNLSSLPAALAGFSSNSLASLVNPAQARTVIKGEYDQCKDTEYESQGLATDPFCVPQYGFDPSVTLGDNQFNQTGPKQYDDTRGFTPDNRYDADAVIAYMLGKNTDSQPWVDGDGNAINYDPVPDCPVQYEGIDPPAGPWKWCMTDYHDYLAACIDTATLDNNSGMCAPKDCHAAASDSREFRYCMYAVFTNDTTLNDQYQDSDADLGSGSSNTGPGGASTDSGGDVGSSLPTGNAKDLAKQIKDSGKVSGDPRYYKQITDIADGAGSCYVSPKILGFILAMSKVHKIYISSLNRRCTGVLTASGTGSLHYAGKGGRAVDVAIVDGKSLGNSQTTSAYSSAQAKQTATEYFKDAVKILPKNAELGQINSCGLSVDAAGFNVVTDTCNHAHVGIP